MQATVIVQARMTSQRLPGKVLREVQGQPLLQYLLDSLGQCRKVRHIAVATSEEASDNPLAHFCQRYGVKLFRGPLQDVAGRFVLALRSSPGDAFVRLCGDSPLLDYRLVDQALDLYRQGHFDLVTNVMPRTFPRGMSVEVVRATTFLKVYQQLQSLEEREHVTQYFYTHRDQFAICNFTAGTDLSHIQLAVDTEADLAHFAAIVSGMQKPHWQYSCPEVCRIYQSLAPAHGF